MKSLIGNKKIIFPEIELCTDNAAMIAYLGELKLCKGEYSDLKFGIEPNLKITTF